MRNDQIFVLLLVVLLPLSGCFDGAVGDAEGTDDTSSDTTIVNNYYNNTTTLVGSNAPIYHQFANGTIVITTSPNEVVEVLSLDAVRGEGYFDYNLSGTILPATYFESWNSYWDAPVNINCTMFDADSIIDLGSTSDTLPSDGGACVYTIQNQWDSRIEGTNYPLGIWPLNGMISITYQIHTTI